MGWRSYLIGLAAAALTAHAAPALAKCTLGKIAELPVTMSGLTPLIKAKVNGQDVTLIADTGAFYSILTPTAARRLGLKAGPVPFGFAIGGMTGAATAQLTTAKDFSLIGFTVHGVEFLVAGETLGGADGILGQNILGVDDMEYDLGNGVVRFFKTTGCENSDLAYWSQGQPYSSMSIDDIKAASGDDPGFENKINGEAQLNGERITVTFDTGGLRSILTLRAARIAGVKVGDPGVISGGLEGGLGGQLTPTWIAPFDSFTVGAEKVEHARLRIADIDVGPDMILGADFFLSHRIYVARSQHRLYFTYNGGAVFDLESSDQGVGAKQPPAGQTVMPPLAADEPKDAAGYARRGAADAGRKQYQQAIADFSKAITLDPADPQHLIDRALAYSHNKQFDLAKADLDAATKLKPDNVDALMARGEVRLASGDFAGGQADLDAAAKLDPERQIKIGGLYVETEHYENAVAAFGAWIAAHPKDPNLASVLNGRCWARGLWGHELEDAVADCDASLRLRHDDAGYLDSRALAHFRLGQLQAALSDYNAAISQQPKQAWSLYMRGLVERKLGQTGKADADIAAAVAISPELTDKVRKLGLAG